MRTALRALPYLLVAFAMFPASSLAATPAAGHARVAIDSASHTADFSHTAARRDVVILHEWERNKMLALKRANPGMKVLMYKNLSFMQRRDDSGNASTGVSTQDAAGHPEWYLLNRSGSRIVSRYYGWLSAADVGLRSYQDRWAADVLNRLAGWDGVFVDDTNPTMRHHYAVDQVAKYPSDAAYQAATGSALSVIGPRLRAAGKLVIPNFGSWSGYRDAVDPWLAHVSGGMEEQFGKWGNTPDVGYVTGNAWERQLGALKATQAAGKLFVAIAHSQANDAAAARYGWATTLLGSQGDTAFSLAADYTNETWFPEYDYDLGAATGAEVRLASGVHRRTFQRGVVLVNPTTAAAAVRFVGPYSGSGLSHSRGTTMAPNSALVLLRDAAAGTAAGSGDESTASDGGSTPPYIETGTASVAGQGSDTAPVQGGPRTVAGSRSSNGPRALRVRVRCHSRTRDCRTRVLVRLRGTGKAVGRRSVRVRAGRARAVRIALNRSGRAALAASPRSLRVVVRPA